MLSWAAIRQSRMSKAPSVSLSLSLSLSLWGPQQNSELGQRIVKTHCGTKTVEL